MKYKPQHQFFPVINKYLHLILLKKLIIVKLYTSQCLLDVV